MARHRILITILTAVSITTAFTSEMPISDGKRPCELPDAHPFKNVLNHINAQISHIEANQCDETYIAAVDKTSNSNILSMIFGTGDDDESPERDYNRAPTKKQEDTITYIFTSLAKFSKTELLRYRSDLNRAGDTIEDIHPLILLSYLFGKEDLRACMDSIHKRGGMVYNKFTRGLFKSLREETQKNNLTRAQINDFAKTLKIKPATIIKELENHDWSGFLEKLFEQIPRQGNPGRYNM